MTRTLLYAVIMAALFAASGWYSADYWIVGNRGNIGAPLSFILLCLSSSTPTWRSIPAAICLYLAWVLSFTIAVLGTFKTASDALTMCMAGTVGALSSLTAYTIRYPEARKLKHMLSVTLIGFVVAVPFIHWSYLHRESENNRNGEDQALDVAFAVWQTAVGVYLTVFTRSQIGKPRSDVMNKPAAART